MASASGLVSTREEKTSRPVTPERELLIATLDRAMFDFHGSSIEQRVSAEEWLFDDLDSDEVFSFGWVCNHLGVNAGVVQRRISDIEITDEIAQARRWLRTKVQSKGAA